MLFIILTYLINIFIELIVQVFNDVNLSNLQGCRKYIFNILLFVQIIIIICIYLYTHIMRSMYIYINNNIVILYIYIYIYIYI